MDCSTPQFSVLQLGALSLFHLTCLKNVNLFRSFRGSNCQEKLPSNSSFFPSSCFLRQNEQWKMPRHPPFVLNLFMQLQFLWRSELHVICNIQDAPDTTGDQSWWGQEIVNPKRSEPEVQQRLYIPCLVPGGTCSEEQSTGIGGQKNPPKQGFVNSLLGEFLSSWCAVEGTWIDGLISSLFYILFQLPKGVYRVPFRYMCSVAGSFSITSIFTEQVWAPTVLKQVHGAPSLPHHVLWLFHWAEGMEDGTITLYVLELVPGSWACCRDQEGEPRLLPGWTATVVFTGCVPLPGSITSCAYNWHTQPCSHTLFQMWVIQWSHPQRVP